MPYGTDLKKLIPVFEISGDSTDFINSAGTKLDVVSGKTMVNFENPVDIIVTTRGGKSKHYRVNVSCKKAPGVEPYNPPNDPAKPDGTSTESGASITIKPQLPRIKEVSVTDITISVTLDNSDENLTGITLQTSINGITEEKDLSSYPFGTNTITVEGLVPLTEYRCSVVTKYNQLRSSPESFIITTEQYPASRIYKPIYNLTEFSQVHPDGLSGNYILLRDIDLENAGWTPIGNFSQKFTGIFEGAGRVVRNLKVIDVNASYVGLFGYISGSGSSDKGEIHNLRLVDCCLDAKQFVGGLVGYSMRGKIYNCHVTGDVDGSNSVTANGYIGGLAGYVNSSSKISNSSADCTVAWNGLSGGYIGGLVGVIWDTTEIVSCFSKGAVTSNGNYTGGLVGLQMDSTVEKSYSTSSVEGKNNTGGLVGSIQLGPSGSTNAFIENCYARGGVTGEDYVGGLVGYKDTSSIVQFCYSTGSVYGNSSKGGLIGMNLNTNVNYSYYYQDPENNAGSKKTEAQMKLQNTYESWPFGTIWSISDLANGGFPSLR